MYCTWVWTDFLINEIWLGDVGTFCESKWQPFQERVSFCTKKQLKDRKVDKPATFFLFSILLLTMADAFEQPGRKESS